LAGSDVTTNLRNILRRSGYNFSTSVILPYLTLLGRTGNSEEIEGEEKHPEYGAHTGGQVGRGTEVA
jgi:hypothetical protein